MLVKFTILTEYLANLVLTSELNEETVTSILRPFATGHLYVSLQQLRSSSS